MADRGELGGLAVSNISVAFGGIAALDGVSMTVDPGEVVGVIGPNGAGKTTLFNVVCGFVRPSVGAISYRGRELKRHSPHDLAPWASPARSRVWGCGEASASPRTSWQAPKPLFGRLRLALLGLWRSSREETRLRRRTMDILGELRISEYADWHPQALPYAIQKRVALARALVSEPSLLLLDEPASGLSATEMENCAC